MYIDILEFLQEDHYQFSASVSEMGENAAKLTWTAAMDYAKYALFVAGDDVDGLTELRDYFKEFGTWEPEEIDNWDAQNLNALLVRDIANSLRTVEHFDTWEEWQEAMSEGVCGGMFFFDGIGYHEGEFITIGNTVNPVAEYYVGN